MRIAIVSCRCLRLRKAALRSVYVQCRYIEDVPGEGCEHNVYTSGSPQYPLTCIILYTPVTSEVIHTPTAKEKRRMVVAEEKRRGGGGSYMEEKGPGSILKMGTGSRAA